MTPKQHQKSKKGAQKHRHGAQMGPKSVEVATLGPQKGPKKSRDTSMGHKPGTSRAPKDTLRPQGLPEEALFRAFKLIYIKLKQ